MEMYQMPAHLIRRLHQISTQVFLVRVQAAGHDVTPVQYAAMQALEAHPGIEQAQVAALIGYDRATIGGVIDRLDQKGLVIRVISRRDRRAREVRLSDDGARQMRALTPIVRTVQEDILSGLEGEEAHQLVYLLKKVLETRAEGSLMSP